METHYDIVQASQSDPITVVVGQGKEQHEVKVPKALIGITSHYLAGLIARDGGLNFQQHPAAAVRTFMRYCYRGRLELDANTKGEERHTLKNDMIELWIFCVKFEILKLRNEAMQALLSNVTVPNLITKRDVKRVWEQKEIIDCGLKWFVICALVAQIEEGTGEHKLEVEGLQRYAAEPGFMVMLYKGLQQWNDCETPKTPKKGKGRTKWSVFVASEEVKKAVMVREKKPEVVNASEGVKRTVVVREKNAVVVKREAPEDGEDGSPGKKAKGFAPGETIDLTED